MFGFGSKCPIDRDIANWIIQSYLWLEQAVDTTHGKGIQPLVTPTADFFPQTGLEGHAKAERFLDIVKEQMGLAHWPCKLQQLEEEIDVKVSETAFIQGAPQGPAGLFGAASGDIIIGYQPKLLKQPVNLIATLAHECSHYYLHGTQEALPEGIEEELLTDLTAVFFGFGVFLANSAFDYQVTNQGWSTRATGYLTGPSLVFALAVFCHRNTVENEDVAGFLKPHLASVFKKSMRYINRNEATLFANAINSENDKPLK